MKINQTQNYISELVELIKNDFINEEGLISLAYPPSKENILPHLDDVFPFLIHLDIDKSFLESQILKSRRHTYKGLVISNGRIISYCNDEYLGALFAYYGKYKEDWLYQLIQESLSGVKKLLVKDKILCTFYDVSNRNTPPVTSPLTADLLEVLIENRDLLSVDFLSEFDDVIKQSLGIWIKSDFFQKYGLFPSKFFLKNKIKNRIFSEIDILLPNKIKKRSGNTFWYSKKRKAPIANFLYGMPIGEKVQCMKENTNLVFCMIEAYRVYGDKIYKEAIDKWIKGLKENMYEEGFIYKLWAPSSKVRVIELSQNFSVIDILCDAYSFVFHKQDYLGFAEELASSWIDEMWDIGLIPRTPKGDYNHLDEQTDFCISLMRLYELTKKEKYREVAERIFEGILRFHKGENGYVLSVGKRGNVINSTISPKYNSLFLKALILFSEKERMYNSDYFHGLLKDR